MLTSPSRTVCRRPWLRALSRLRRVLCKCWNARLLWQGARGLTLHHKGHLMGHLQGRPVAAAEVSRLEDVAVVEPEGVLMPPLLLFQLLAPLHLLQLLLLQLLLLQPETPHEPLQICAPYRQHRHYLLQTLARPTSTCARPD